jgi:hypothetical protein
MRYPAANQLPLGGLVNIVLRGINVDILELHKIDVDIIDDVTIRNVANNNNLSVAAIINILGGPSAILTQQT